MANLIITFRETFEAALVIGIVLSYLWKTKQTYYNRYVYLGASAAIGVSIVVAILFVTRAREFMGNAEQIFEGSVMLLGAVLLTTMIFWMMRQKNISTRYEKKVQAHIDTTRKLGIFFLIFFAVLREGVETIIFLSAFSLASQRSSIFAALTGIVLAIILGYFIFLSTKRIPIKKFFHVTSILLILFAAGLISHGVHELQTAQVLPTFQAELWNINPTVTSENVFPILHEKGYIGSIFKGLFGYDGNPSLLEVMGYLSYILVAVFMWNAVTIRDRHQKLED